MLPTLIDIFLLLFLLVLLKNIFRGIYLIFVEKKCVENKKKKIVSPFLNIFSCLFFFPLLKQKNKTKLNKT